MRRLLDLCNDVYANPQFVAGPNERDAASFIGDTLVFRGTVTEGEAAESDWLNDFRADLVKDAEFPGRVHGGFLASFHALLPFIHYLRPAYITGHSKGGALAMLAAWYFRGQAPKVVTFGAPRVGNGQFAESPLSIVRFENPGDMVPKLPPWFASPGMAVVAPKSFRQPVGVRANHSLDTGYTPWIPSGI